MPATVPATVLVTTAAVVAVIVDMAALKSDYYTRQQPYRQYCTVVVYRTH